MARRSTPDGWVSPLDAPSNVRVTVVPGPRGHQTVRPARKRSGTTRVGIGRPLLIASVVLVLAAGAIVAVALPGGRQMSAAPARDPDAGTAATPATVLATEGRTAGNPAPATATEGATTAVARIAAAYRYPLGCLGITLSADRSSMPGRQSPCWRYGVYITAVLRQVNGVWRLMLQATSPRCPAVPLPNVVRSALISCERSPAPARAPSG
jgi:hypothetical protein